MTAYQVGKEYSGALERKNAIGIWTKKFVTLKGVSVSVHDAEGQPAVANVQLSGIQRVPGETLCVNFVGGQDSLVIRAPDSATANYWYDLAYAALEVAGKVKPRNCGLPPADPRNGQRFIDVPADYATAFQNLAQSVLYWFEPVRKIGMPSKLTGRDTIEERIVFVGDQCIYVTKGNSELTRCMKIAQMKRLVTNLGDASSAKEAPFVVVKMAPPEYDLAFTVPAAESFISTVGAVFKALSKGVRLPVEKTSGYRDPSVSLQLSRPQDFSMTLVVPTPKEALKIALDKYAASHGILISSTGVANRVKGPAAGGVSSPANSTLSPKAGGGAGGAKMSPLRTFFAMVNLPQYVSKLEKQGIDLDVLEVAEEDDMANFGIKDRAHAKLIKEKIGNPDFMADVKSGGGLGRTVSSIGSPSNRPPIIFDDDDDFALPSQGGGGGANASKAAFIDLDDLDLPPPKPAGGAGGAGAAFTLIDDDDLDLPPPKAKAAVALDDI